MTRINRITSSPVRYQQSAHDAVSHAPALSLPHDTLGWVAAGLAAAVLVLLFTYVTQTNRLASQAWKMKDDQAQMATLLENRNDIVARQAQLDDRAVLQNLAVKNGLVPAGTVAYLVQNTSVATAR